MAAKYLPFAHLLLKFVSGADGFKKGLLGIFSAHLYLFFETIWPMAGGRKFFFMNTPELLKRWLPQKNEVTSGYRVYNPASGNRRDNSSNTGSTTTGSNSSTTTSSTSRFQGKGHRLGS